MCQTGSSCVRRNDVTSLTYLCILHAPWLQSGSFYYGKFRLFSPRKTSDDSRATQPDFGGLSLIFLFLKQIWNRVDCRRCETDDSATFCLGSCSDHWATLPSSPSRSALSDVPGCTIDTRLVTGPSRFKYSDAWAKRLFEAVLTFCQCS